MALCLAGAQVASGHRVSVVSLASIAGAALTRRFEELGVPTYELPKRAGFDAHLHLKLFRLFRRLGSEVVHTHNPQPLIYSAVAAKLTGAAVVHTKHGANPDLPRRKWLRRQATRFVDAYVAVSEGTAVAAANARDCAPRKLSVIANGIDVERFAQNDRAGARIRRELGIPESAFVVGTIGRLAPEKRQDLLIDAAAPLLGEERQLVIVGDGPERQRLAAKVRELPERRWIHLTGTRTDAPAVLSAFDVFALSSSTEGLPLVIVEAMAASLPIVSTAVGGIANVVESGKTGYLVQSGARAELTQRLAELASDRMLAETMGQKGRRVAEARYSAQRMTSDYLALYERLRPGGRRRPTDRLRVKAAGGSAWSP